MAKKKTPKGSPMQPVAVFFDVPVYELPIHQEGIGMYAVSDRGTEAEQHHFVAWRPDRGVIERHVSGKHLKAYEEVDERRRQGRETATVERVEKAGAENIEIAAALKDDQTRHGATVQRLVDAPLDILAKSGHLTKREYEAGDQYRADAYLAAIDPGALTVDWNATGGGTSARVPTMFSSQTIADARIRWRRIEERFPRQSIEGALLFLALVKELRLAEIGRNLFGIRDQREGEVAVRCAFRVALSVLARDITA